MAYSRDDPPETMSSELWFLIVVLISIQIIVTFTSLTLAVSAPSVAKYYNISAEFIGYQVSLIYVAAALTATSADYQLSRWGAIRASQFSLLFSALGAILLILPSLLFIVIGSLFIGIGYGMTNPAASQILMGSTPAKYRNIVFSLKQTGVLFGSRALGWTGIIQAEAVSNAPLRHSGAVIGALSVPMFGGVIFGPAVFSMLVSFTQSYSNAFLLLVLFAGLSFICLGMLSSLQQFKEDTGTAN